MQVDWHMVGAVLLCFLLTGASVLRGCLSFLVLLALLDGQYPDKGRRVAALRQTFALGATKSTVPRRKYRITVKPRAPVLRYAAVCASLRMRFPSA
jgi:hypothetical protein